MNKYTKTVTLASLLFSSMCASAAVVISYPDFSDVTGLTLNGSAAQVGTALRVTPAIDSQSGSVFSTTTVSLSAGASFSTYFQFQFTAPDLGFCDSGTTCGADGLVFAVQTVGNNVGGSGGGIGYSGIANSIGIEFDTWNNGGIDSFSSNHIGLDTNGSVASIVLAEVTDADMNDGDIWNAWVDYNSLTQLLEARLTRSLFRPTTALISETIDIATILGTTDAFVGFTSGTGASHANHDVLTWTLNDSFEPIGTGEPIGSPIPEPATLALLGFGLMGIALRKNRNA